jgi:hypothetical protein
MAHPSGSAREASAGAFANVFVFGTLASTIAFTLGATSKAAICDRTQFCETQFSCLLSVLTVYSLKWADLTVI